MSNCRWPSRKVYSAKKKVPVSAPQPDKPSRYYFVVGVIALGIGFHIGKCGCCIPDHGPDVTRRIMAWLATKLNSTIRTSLPKSVPKYGSHANLRGCVRVPRCNRLRKQCPPFCTVGLGHTCRQQIISPPQKNVIARMAEYAIPPEQ